MDPNALAPVVGGGTLGIVILYLLRFISHQQGRADKAQDAAVARAEARAAAAEARADAAERKLAERLAEIADPGGSAYRRHRAQLEGRSDDPA